MTLNPLMTRERIVVPPRPTPTKQQRIAIWNRENGICWWCGKPVAFDGSTVEYDHKIARELLGGAKADAPENLFPLHARPCHADKTSGEDRPRTDKAHRQEKLTRVRVAKRNGFRRHPTKVRGVDGQVRERAR